MFTVICMYEIIQTKLNNIKDGLRIQHLYNRANNNNEKPNINSRTQTLINSD